MQQKIDVYLAYAHEDELLRNELVKHLNVLILEGLVNMWCDRDIIPGTERQPAIDLRLNVARLILLLVSSSFVSSDYSHSVEVKRAMERHTTREARIIPIILRHCMWKPSVFGMLQPLPTNGEPIVSAHWHSQDEAFLNVAEGIRAVVKELITNRAPVATTTPTFQKTKEQYMEEFEVYYKVNSYAKALSAIERALTLDPTFVDAHNNRGLVLRKLNQKDEALAAFNHAIQLNPTSSQAYNNKGNIFLDKEHFIEALTLYEQALALNPNLVEAYGNKGEALRKLDRNLEALTACDQALALNPIFVNAYITKGAALRQLNRKEEALEVLNQAIELDPNKVDAHNGKGIVLSMLNRYEAAIEAYNQAIKLDPNCIPAYTNKGSLLRLLGRYEEAELVYDKIEQLTH